MGFSKCHVQEKFFPELNLIYLGMFVQQNRKADPH